MRGFFFCPINKMCKIHLNALRALFIFNLYFAEDREHSPSEVSRAPTLTFCWWRSISEKSNVIMEDYNITALDYIEMINSNNLVLVAGWE